MVKCIKSAMAQAAVLLISVGLSAPSAAESERHDGAMETAPDRASTLVIGRVSSSPSEYYQRLGDLNDIVVSRLGGTGITASRVIFAQNMPDMIALLEEGKVDYLSETLFAALDLEWRGLGHIALREWKGGVASYRGLIVVHRDSDLSSLAGLGGQSFLFEDAGSTSGFMLPFMALQDAGLDLKPAWEALAGASTEAHADRAEGNRLTFTFAKTEKNVVTGVALGHAAAGAVSDRDWLDPRKVPVTVRDKLKILHTSDPVPRSALVIRANLDPAVQEGLKKVLANLHEDAEGRRVLAAYFNVARFDHFDEAPATPLSQLRKEFRKLAPDLVAIQAAAR